MPVTVGDLNAILTLDKSQFDSGLSQAESKMSGFGGKAAGVGSAMAGALATAGVAAGVAAAGIATAGLSAFKNLESAASSAASKAVDVNGKSAEQIKAQYSAIQDHVIAISNDLAATTIFDPTQVANAFDVLAAKGANIANIGKAELLPFLDLAASTQSDLASVTDLVTGSINAFGLEMTDSQSVADQMAMAMNGSSASMDTLNFALRQGGATASASGMQLSEFSAIVGVLADKNYTGEQSGAALKTALLALYTPTQKQTDTLTKLGLTYDQVDPRTHKFRDTLELLLSKGADIGDFGNIFTDSSGAIMYALAGSGDAVDALAEKIGSSSGLAHAQASLIMDTNKLVGAWETAKGATEGMTTAIGGALEPAAVKLLNTWTAMVPKIQEFAVALASGDWSTAGQLLSEGWDAAKEGFGQLWDSLKEKVDDIDWGEVAAQVGQRLTEGLRSAWNTLSDLGSQLLSWLQGVDWGAVSDTLVESIKTGWEMLEDLGQTLYDWIMAVDWAELASGIAGKIVEGWKRFSEWATGIIDGLTADLQTWVDSNGPGEIGKNLALAIAEGAADLGRWIYDKIANWWTSSGSSIGGLIASIINFAGVAARAAYDFVTSFAKTIWDLGAGTIGASIVEAIADALDSVEVGGSKLFGSLTTDMREWATDARAKADAIWAGQPEAIRNGLTNPLTSEIVALEARGINIPVKYHISQSGDIFYAYSDETSEEYGTQRGQILGTGSTREAALEAAIARFETAAPAIASAGESNAQSAESNAQAAESTARATEGLATQAGSTEQSASHLSEASATHLESLRTGAQEILANADELNARASAAADEEIAKGNAQAEADIARITGSNEQTVKAATDSATTQKKGATDSAEIQKKGATESAAIRSKADSEGAALLTGGAKNAFADLTKAGLTYSGFSTSAGRILLADSTSSGTQIRTSGDHLAACGIRAGNALNNAVSALNNAWSYIDASRPDIWGYAGGTKTTGPEVALIGEAGTEYVIPGDRSRPDLLSQAMVDYGVSDQFSNVSSISVTRAAAGGGTSGTFAALEKAAAMLASATKALASTAEALEGAIESMASAASDWATTVTETTTEINTLDTETAQSIVDMQTETANAIKDISMETANKNKEIADEIATNIKEKMNGGASAIQDAGIGAGGSIMSAGTTFGQLVIDAGQGMAGIIAEVTGTFSERLMQTNQTMVQQLIQGANSARINMINGGVSAGNSMRTGGAQAAAALMDAAYAILSAASSSSGHALGTVTSGPELAWIGEAGKEYVIPTQTKRWDLLYAAMADYGLKVPKLASGGVFNQAAISRIAGPAPEARIVLEDHTVHELYIDGQKVTDIFFTRAARKIKTRQGALSNW